MADDKKVQLTNPHVIVPLMLEHGDELIIGVKDNLTQAAIDNMVKQLDRHLPGIRVLIVQCESLVVRRP